eukprot:13822518-Heterocapsa_arctica.AAC.1
MAEQWVVQCEFCVKRIYAETHYGGLCRIHQHAEAAHSSRVPTPAAGDAMVRRLPWTRGGGAFTAAEAATAAAAEAGAPLVGWGSAAWMTAATPDYARRALAWDDAPPPAPPMPAGGFPPMVPVPPPPARIPPVAPPAAL